MAETATPAATPELTKADLRKPGFLVSLLGALLPGLYLLITSTTTLVTSIWPYDFKRMLQFALLFVLFLLPAVSRPIRNEFGQLLGGVPRWVGWTLIFVFGWGVLSASVNAQSWMHYANSLSEVALLGSLVLGVFVVGACRRVGGMRFDQAAIGLIALTGLGVGVQELMGVFAAHAGGIDFNFRISLLHYSWPRFYNQVQTWTIPILAALPMLFTRSSLAKVVCVLVLGLHWYVILMTGARGSFVGLAAGMAFGLIFLPGIRGPLMRWQLTGMIFGAVLYALVLYSFEPADVQTPPSSPASATVQAAELRKGFYNNEDKSTSGFLAQSVGRPLLDPMGRIGMWRVTLQDAKAHPWLGIGPMNYVCTSPAYIGHPHNFPLQLTAEWGIPATLAACILAGILLLMGTYAIRTSHADTEVGNVVAGLALTGVLAASIHACVSGVLVMPASQIAGLAIVGLLIGMHGSLKPKGGPILLQRANFFGAALAAALFLLGIHELSTMEERSVHMRPGEDLRPRMWQDGKVCRLYVSQIAVSN